MKTCRHCKYWSPDVEDEGKEIQRRCNNEKLHSSDRHDGLDSNADTWYYSYTGPDFGCIHWSSNGTDQSLSSTP